MKFKKTDLRSNTLFHYTTLENARKIIEERKVRTGNDVFCFFTESEEKARELFSELMEQGTEYIGDDLKIHKRKYCSPLENVILKITVKNDNQFYRFICETDGFNPYEYSVLHFGELIFENVEILPIVQKEIEQTVSNTDVEAERLYKKNPYKNGLKRMAAAGVLAAILTTNAFPVFASSTSSESWLDPGKYDISWYSASETNFEITTAAQLAGISYLAGNNENLKGKRFNIMNDIDLTAYEWDTIPKSFEGVIEGLHKVLLIKTDQTPFTEDLQDKGDVSVLYSVPVGGIENGKTYCSAVDVIVFKGAIAKVVINGTEATVTDGKFTVPPQNGGQKIVVTDKGGGEMTYTITVNDGHTWAEAYNSTAHWQECSVCQVTKDQAAHSFDSELDTTCNGCSFTRTMTYTITEGAGQTVTKGNSAIFTSQAPFDKFLGVQIDGENVEDTNYTAVSGSTRITLKADYINGLAEGEHTLAIISNDGAASTVFTVNAKSVTPDDTTGFDDRVKPGDESNPDNDIVKGVNAPGTGDSSYMVPWAALLFICGVGIAAILIKKKRQIR